jgi:hypothetical protein
MPTVAYKTNNRLTAEEIEVRVWAFVIVIWSPSCLALW